MEICNSLKSYWVHKSCRYQRLSGSSENRSVARLGGAKRKSSWRRCIKIKVKLFRRVSSPKKLLLQMRDAYVNAMLLFSGRQLQTKKKMIEGRPKAARASEKKLSEFERRMILHICNNVMSRPEELVSCV